MAIVTKISAKGQLVIPIEIRKKLNIDENTRLVIREEKGEIIIRVVNWEYIQSFKGIFKSPNGESALDWKVENRKEELAAEDRKLKRWKK